MASSDCTLLISFVVLISFQDFNLDEIVTPVKIDVFERLLREINYDEKETNFLVNGFTNGFSIGYAGPTERRDTANNLKLCCGTKFDLWEKIMKEVQLHRFAGPYSQVPVEYFIQSPTGLVPKSDGMLRLIFHLSYSRSGVDSVNDHTPDELCTMKYRDLDNTTLS